MEDDSTWKLRARRMDADLRSFCNEAIADGRIDRLCEIAKDLFELRQQILDVEHVREKGEKATRPYPWWLREWKRTTHWLLFAEMLDREERMTQIRNRLIGPNRNTDALQEQDDYEGPRRLIDRLACWLFQPRQKTR